jgi:hypothetical protein
MSTFPCFGPTSVKLGVWEHGWIGLSRFLPSTGLTLLARRMGRLPQSDQGLRLGFVGISRWVPHISHDPSELEFAKEQEMQDHMMT